MALASVLDLRFEQPGYLALLAVLPLVVVLSIRSLSGLGPIRRWLAIGARCAVLAAMVLALAGAQRVSSTDALSVIFLVDRSSSVPRPQQQNAFEFVVEAAKGLRPTKDRMGIIAFDGSSAVEQLPMNALGISKIGEPVRPDRTNIEKALGMALALFTDDTARRVVVLSDGNENVGQALSAADQFRAAGVPIDVVPLRYQIDDEVVFERLTAPPTATSEETIDLQMVLRASKPTDGEIQVYHNDQLIDLDPSGPGYGFPVQLDAGPNRHKVQVPLRVAGAHRFRAVFKPRDPKADTIEANNEGRAFTVVSGQGRILLLAKGGEDDAADVRSAQILTAALEREKFVVDLEAAGSQPLDQVRLLEYSLVILSNVSANLLTEEERKALAVYVRDLGGGLVMVGGDDSFGAGGWMDTPIEEVMPVSFDVPSKKIMQKGALVLVMHACEIPQGNYWGERVAIAAVKTLSTRDLVGVLSYKWQGAEQKYWDVPLQEVRDKGRIIGMIKQMQMGDMPDLDAVMRPGVEELMRRKDAGAKHMIVISDFDPAPPRSDLIDTMKKHKITCSTVAIGWGGHWIDTGKAQQIADDTGGKFYSTHDYSQLPQIFIKESKIVSRTLIQELTFNPQLASTTSTLVEGLAGEGLPPLGGYVLTTAKPLANVPLVRMYVEEGAEGRKENRDPILAHWQVGLGKTVAFTSGMWPRWGSEWTEWPKFSKLWAQVARWASRQSAAAAFDVSTSVQGGRGRIRIDALDRNAATINFMSIQGALVDPKSDASPLQLTQTAPGRYEAEFNADEPGSYVLNLSYTSGRGADAISGTLQTGVSVAFSAEYKQLATNEPLLRELAERTGGRTLDKSTARGAFDMTALPKAEARRSIWEDLVRWMLLLFLIDVAVRRIAINPVEVARKLRRYIHEMAGSRRAGESAAEVLTTLRGSRDKVRETSAGPPAGRPSDAGPAPNRSARYEAPVPDAKVAEQLSRALGGASETDAPVVARPTKKPPPTSEVNFAERLRKAKQQARERMADEQQPPESSG